MAGEDLQITVAARRLLTSHWIDITRARLRTTRGVLHVSGSLRRMTFEHGELTEANLQKLNLLLRQIRGVRSVSYRLDNWKRDSLGAWCRRLPGEVAEGDGLTEQATEPPAAG